MSVAGHVVRFTLRIRVPEGQHDTVVIITNNLDTQTYIRITLRIYKYDVHIVLYDVYYINS